MTPTLTSILADITSVFTAAIGWVGQVATTVVDTPLLLVGCILGIGGVAISYFKRLV